MSIRHSLNHTIVLPQDRATQSNEGLSTTMISIREPTQQQRVRRTSAIQVMIHCIIELQYLSSRVLSIQVAQALSSVMPRCCGRGSSAPIILQTTKQCRWMRATSDLYRERKAERVTNGVHDNVRKLVVGAIFTYLQGMTTITLMSCDVPGMTVVLSYVVPPGQQRLNEVTVHILFMII